MKKNILLFVLLFSCLIFFSSFAFAFMDTSINVTQELRNIRDVIYSIDFLIRTIIFLLALGIGAIAVLAYIKKRSQRLFFVSIAFSLFAVKWLLKIVDLFFFNVHYFTDPIENVFELLILALLFLALVRK
ncbi:MAG: hypothetical protein ABH821_00560 [archaeon]